MYLEVQSTLSGTAAGSTDAEDTGGDWWAPDGGGENSTTRIVEFRITTIADNAAASPPTRSIRLIIIVLVIVVQFWQWSTWQLSLMRVGYEVGILGGHRLGLPVDKKKVTKRHRAKPKLTVFTRSWNFRILPTSVNGVNQ